jgi:RimJ/RimL family protein N-acetyltransferase
VTGLIQGKKVALRPTEEADHALIHAWMNHPEVWRYMDYERPYSMADVKEDLERARRDGQPFTIVVGERPIGRIGLNQFRRRDRICSLYMFIGEPAFWGAGYASDAVMTLLSYAFERFDLHQVELWTLADNNRALVMYERWKQGGWVDHVVMSVKRGEFEKARQAWQGGTSAFVTQDS